MIVITSVAGLHNPFPVVVSVSVKIPAAVSAELGVYVAFSVVAVGEKVPVPAVLQVPPEATELTEPFKVTSELFAHTV